MLHFERKDFKAEYIRRFFTSVLMSLSHVQMYEKINMFIRFQSEDLNLSPLAC